VEKLILQLLYYEQSDQIRKFKYIILFRNPIATALSYVNYFQVNNLQRQALEVSFQESA